MLDNCFNDLCVPRVLQAAQSLFKMLEFFIYKMMEGRGEIERFVFVFELTINWDIGDRQNKIFDLFSA